MTKKDNNTELLIEIRSKVAGIEQHLSDMNGWVKRHETHITDKCPDNRKDINERISIINNLVTRNTVVTSMIYTITIGVLMAYMKYGV